MLASSRDCAETSASDCFPKFTEEEINFSAMEMPAPAATEAEDDCQGKEEADIRATTVVVGEEPVLCICAIFGEASPPSLDADAQDVSLCEVAKSFCS